MANVCEEMELRTLALLLVVFGDKFSKKFCLNRRACEVRRTAGEGAAGQGLGQEGKKAKGSESGSWRKTLGGLLSS